MAYLLIDPSEKLDYTCDWSGFLDDGGSPSDSISTSTWSIVPQSPGSPTHPQLTGAIHTANTATVFVEAGMWGEIYQLSNQITTTMGRTAERSFTIRCETR